MKFTKVIKAESEKDKREAALRVIYRSCERLRLIIDNVLKNWDWDNRNDIDLKELWKIAHAVSDLEDSRLLNKLGK